MKLPLFVHTSPVPSDSSIVSVSAGEWFVELDSKDAILNLGIISGDNTSVMENIQNGQSLNLHKPSHVRASIVKAGTERHISLYLNDTKSHPTEE